MLVVFDLDFTLWDCGGTWCDHTNPPYSLNNGIVTDFDRRTIELYEDVPAILDEMSRKDMMLAVASRTTAPDWAEELMHLFDIKKYFRFFEIYPGSKVSHFQSLQAKTGLPYNKMVFFDDEYRNIDEVDRLGVDAVFVEDGINLQLLKRYLQK